MRRSKYGYLLLALLVITGLAGTLTSSSINSKERKLAVTSMKESKLNLLKTMQGLSSHANDKAIKETIYQVTTTEKNLWKILESSLQQPAKPDARSFIKISDEQLFNLIKEGKLKIEPFKFSGTSSERWKNTDDAIESFKKSRNLHVRYIKNTTEDLRNRVVQLPFGYIDCYQLCLVIAANTEWRTKQLNDLKSNQNYTE